MKKIINIIKRDLFLLKEEDKLYMLPWEMMKWVVSTPTAWKYKGRMLIPQDKRWNWKRTDKAPSGVRARDAKGRYIGDDESTDDWNEAYEDGKSPVNQTK